MKFKDFIEKFKNGSIIFFDIDETLLRTFAKIHVIKDGEVIRKLNNQEFNTYELQDGESYDFVEFRDINIFNASKPIETMINLFNNIMLKFDTNSQMILLTARSEFYQGRKKLIEVLEKLGIGMKNVKVELCGNLKYGSVSDRKKYIIRKYLNSGRYCVSGMIDDDRKNLEVFLSIQDEFPNINFYAYLVANDEELKLINESTVTGDVAQNVTKDDVTLMNRTDTISPSADDFYDEE